MADDSRNRRLVAGLGFSLTGLTILFLSEHILHLIAGIIAMAFGSLLMYFSIE